MSHTHQRAMLGIVAVLAAIAVLCGAADGAVAVRRERDGGGGVLEPKQVEGSSASYQKASMGHDDADRGLLLWRCDHNHQRCVDGRRGITNLKWICLLEKAECLEKYHFDKEAKEIRDAYQAEMDKGHSAEVDQLRVVEKQRAEMATKTEAEAVAANATKTKMYQQIREHKSEVASSICKTAHEACYTAADSAATDIANPQAENDLIPSIHNCNSNARACIIASYESEYEASGTKAIASPRIDQHTRTCFKWSAPTTLPYCWATMTPMEELSVAKKVKVCYDTHKKCILESTSKTVETPRFDYHHERALHLERQRCGEMKNHCKSASNDMITEESRKREYREKVRSAHAHCSAQLARCEKLKSPVEPHRLPSGQVFTRDDVSDAGAWKHLETLNKPSRLRSQFRLKRGLESQAKADKQTPVDILNAFIEVSLSDSNVTDPEEKRIEMRQDEQIREAEKESSRITPETFEEKVERGKRAFEKSQENDVVALHYSVDRLEQARINNSDPGDSVNRASFARSSGYRGHYRDVDSAKAEGLTSYWLFDGTFEEMEGFGGKTFVSRSEDRKPSFLSGEAWSPFSGIVEKSNRPSLLDFDGVDDFIMHVGSSAISKARFTLTIWSFLDDANSAEENPMPTRRSYLYDGGGGRVSVAVQGSDHPIVSKNRPRGENGDEKTLFETEWSPDGATQMKGQWCMHALTFDGKTARYFVDGDLRGSVDASENPDGSGVAVGPWSDESFSVGAMLQGVTARDKAMKELTDKGDYESADKVLEAFSKRPYDPMKDPGFMDGKVAEISVWDGTEVPEAVIRDMFLRHLPMVGTIKKEAGRAVSESESITVGKDDYSPVLGDLTDGPGLGTCEKAFTACAAQIHNMTSRCDDDVKCRTESGHYAVNDAILRNRPEMDVTKEAISHVAHDALLLEYKRTNMTNQTMLRPSDSNMLNRSRHELEQNKLV